jgi:hypothetical protein
LLAKLAGGAADPDQRALAKAILEKNGRDPKTGRKEKLPVGATDPGKSPGFPEELKVAAANREFAARIGQMQLEDWKKRISPEVLKRAGVSEAEWQRYVKSMQSYGDMVRELNAKIARDALKELHHGANAGVKAAPTSGTRNTQLEGVRPDPPELRDPIRRFRMP